jgi:LmbE family N-acetylglucosaminyl deacetylase
MALLVDRLLCVIAHPDDETLGCGGTLRRLASSGADVRVLLPVRRTDPRGRSRWPELLEEFSAACEVLGVTPIVSTSAMTEECAEIDLKALHDLVEPHAEWAEAIVTHAPGDVHQVHRQVSRAVEVATRPFRRRRAVAFMEVPTSTDQAYNSAFAPNLFVRLGQGDVDRKVEAMRCYTSEAAPGREADDLDRQLRVRGRQIGTDFAEAFVLARSFV